MNVVFWTHKFAVGLIDMENSDSQDPHNSNIVNESLKLNTGAKEIPVCINPGEPENSQSIRPLPSHQ